MAVAQKKLSTKVRQLPNTEKVIIKDNLTKRQHIIRGVLAENNTGRKMRQERRLARIDSRKGMNYSFLQPIITGVIVVIAARWLSNKLNVFNKDVDYKALKEYLSAVKETGVHEHNRSLNDQQIRVFVADLKRIMNEGILNKVSGRSERMKRLFIDNMNDDGDFYAAELEFGVIKYDGSGFHEPIFGILNFGGRWMTMSDILRKEMTSLDKAAVRKHLGMETLGYSFSFTGDYGTN